MDINSPFTAADVAASLRRAAGLPEVAARPEFVEEEPLHPPKWNSIPGTGRRRKAATPDR